jgi:hypothetical protein
VLAAASYFLLFSGAPPSRSLEDAVAPSSAPAPAAAAPAPAPAAAPEPAAEPAPERRRAAAPAPAPAPAAPAEPAAPTMALLRIDSDVPGAQVFVDRRFIGAAPVTADDIAPGSHVINVTAPGFEGVSTTVDVAAGPRDVIVKLREVRLNAKAEVVHKHRIGSCTGTLVATPRGLRYETTNKDDAFSAALTDLETFEVDYLEKNLKIRVKGKQYNFTDPQGNADKLFVFHRDVEKARDRLKKGDPPAEE